MKDLNYISHEITKNKNLDLNIPKYIAGMDSLYYTLGYVKMSMNFYTLYDMIHESKVDESITTLFDEFCNMVNTVFAGNREKTDWYKAELEIENIRNNIIETMEAVTAFVDALRIFEYVLNRIEHRFLDETVDENYYNTYMTNDIMHYIFEDRDNVVINSKINEVVGQLPMRLSSSKFYEYIRDAFSLYHGAQKGTIDDFAYALRTSAGINSYDKYSEQFPLMEDILNTLKNADYTSIEADEFKRLIDALEIGTEKMNECADMYVLFAQMVNDAYTIILCSKNAMEDSMEVIAAKDILKEIYESHFDDSDEPVSLYDKFAVFEGCQERAMSVISKSDFAIDYVLNSELEDKDGFIKLSKVGKLQSGSDFVRLNDDESLSEIPDDSYADEVCADLIEQFGELFKSVKTPVKRAVMSIVLSQLPVFFNNIDEIQSYINLSLEQCNDNSEKMAVIEIMKQIINV